MMDMYQTDFTRKKQSSTAKYTHLQRAAIRERIRELAHSGFYLERITGILRDEGFTAPGGRELSSEIVTRQAAASEIYFRNGKPKYRAIPENGIEKVNFPTAPKYDVATVAAPATPIEINQLGVIRNVLGLNMSDAQKLAIIAQTVETK